MKISFDSAKRIATLQNRGLDMSRAGEAICGASLTVEDRRRDYGETRFITIGFLDQRMVVIVWTARGEGRGEVQGEQCRVISIRKANDREQALYGPRFEG